MIQDVYKHAQSGATNAVGHDAASSESRSALSQLGASKLKGTKYDASRTAAFLIHPYPQTEGDQVTIRMLPLIFMRRSQLPLSFLDSRGPIPFQPSTRLFYADIKMLESENNEPPVLIAAVSGQSQLFVVEKARDKVYTIMRLVSRVDTSLLQTIIFKYSTNTVKRPFAECRQNDDGDCHWWDAAHVARPSLSRPIKRKRLSGDHRNVAASPELRVERSKDPQQPTDTIETAEPGGVDPHSETDIVDTLLVTSHSEDEVISGIVSQYLDALYLSKAPLAYFTKGPLSRIRALFTVQQEPSRQPQQLPFILRSMILGISNIDKKYKEILPDFVKSLVGLELSTNDRVVKTTRSRKAKKLKLGKNSLYTTEEDFIKPWWNNTELVSQLTSEEQALSFLKARIAQLRFREHLLQIILTMEILAIEATVPDSANDDMGLSQNAQLLDKSAKSNGKAESARKVKQKGPLDLKFHLEMLVDRLCIWQSMHTNDDPISTKPVPDQVVDLSNGEGNIDSSNNPDQLRDFYSGVLIPFYGRRIPNVVETLSRSLGVKTGPSPLQRKHASSSKQDHFTIPGTEIARSSATKSRREVPKPSGRRATHSKASPPKLVRSATDSLLQQVQRERSMTPQSEFNLKNGRRTFSRSNSISQTKNLNQREVDFSAINKYNENKSKKKDQIEQELHEAIATLKKPNRGLAVKEYFKEAEQLKPGANIHSSKLRQSRTKSLLGVQVGATPQRTNKNKIESATTPLPSFKIDSITSASQPRIPTSTLRPGTRPSLPNGFSPSRNSSDMDGIVGRTPTRSNARPLLNPRRLTDEVVLGSSPMAQRHESSLFEPGILPGSPIANRRTGSFARTKSEINVRASRKSASLPFAAKANNAMEIVSMNVDDAEHVDDMCENTGVVTSKAGSIYESLGWDDDDVDELM